MNKEILQSIKRDILIQTGIATAAGINMALNAGFKQIISIEANRDYFDNAENKFKGNANVVNYYGDSGLVLPDILRDIKEPVTIWLDAHIGALRPSKDDAERLGELPPNPILTELKAIANHPIKTHTIMIDDVAYFREPRQEWGYINLKQVLTAIHNVNRDYSLRYLPPTDQAKVLIAEVPV